MSTIDSKQPTLHFDFETSVQSSDFLALETNSMLDYIADDIELHPMYSELRPYFVHRDINKRLLGLVIAAFLSKEVLFAMLSRSVLEDLLKQYGKKLIGRCTLNGTETKTFLAVALKNNVLLRHRNPQTISKSESEGQNLAGVYQLRLDPFKTWIIDQVGEAALSDQARYVLNEYDKKLSKISSMEASIANSTPNPTAYLNPDDVAASAHGDQQHKFKEEPKEKKNTSPIGSRDIFIDSPGMIALKKWQLKGQNCGRLIQNCKNALQQATRYLPDDNSLDMYPEALKKAIYEDAERAFHIGGFGIKPRKLLQTVISTDLDRHFIINHKQEHRRRSGWLDTKMRLKIEKMLDEYEFVSEATAGKSVARLNPAWHIEKLCDLAQHLGCIESIATELSAGLAELFNTGMSLVNRNLSGHQLLMHLLHIYVTPGQDAAKLAFYRNYVNPLEQRLWKEFHRDLERSHQNVIVPSNFEFASEDDFYSYESRIDEPTSFGFGQYYWKLWSEKSRSGNDDYLEEARPSIEEFYLYLKQTSELAKLEEKKTAFTDNIKELERCIGHQAA